MIKCCKRVKDRKCLPLHPCSQRCRISPVSIWGFRLSEEEVESEEMVKKRRERWWDRESERGNRVSLVWSHTVHSQAGPWSHQLIMIHIPALDVVGTLQSCPPLQAHTHIHIDIHTRTSKRAVTESHIDGFLDSLSLYDSINVRAERVVPFAWVLGCLYRWMCLCPNGVNWVYRWWTWSECLEFQAALG